MTLQQCLDDLYDAGQGLAVVKIVPAGDAKRMEIKPAATFARPRVFIVRGDAVTEEPQDR